jgi:hypothetical protein
MHEPLSFEDIQTVIARARRGRSDALGQMILGARVRGYALALGIGAAALWAGALLLSPPRAEAEAAPSLPTVAASAPTSGD